MIKEVFYLVMRLPNQEGKNEWRFFRWSSVVFEKVERPLWQSGSDIYDAIYEPLMVSAYEAVRWAA